jgi:hypothetical protein
MSAQHVHLTDWQVQQIVSALLIAKAQFVVDADKHRDHPGLREQFIRQAAQAGQLVELLDGADVVVS